MESINPSPGDGEQVTKYLLSMSLGGSYDLWKAGAVKQKLHQSGVCRTAEQENEVLDHRDSGA